MLEHNARRFSAILAALLGLTPAAALGGPLDPDDAARVKVIQTKVDDQLRNLTDTNLAMDSVIDAAELSNREVDSFLAINAAQLRLDIEQALLGSCARKCARAPEPPTAQQCWHCVSPRFVLPNVAGGYLEDVRDVVQDDLDAAVSAGLAVDAPAIQKYLDRAAEAQDVGELDQSFALACQAFGLLACDNHDPEPERSSAGSFVPVAGEFAGASRRTR